MKLRGLGGLLVVGVLAAGGAWLATSPQAFAQATKAGKPAKPKPVQTRSASTDRPGRDIDLDGRVVSVQTYMLGTGKTDATKATADALRAGAAAALDSPMGLVILGQGNAGGMRVLLPLANREVQVHGKLYEKGGAKYLDIGTINAAGKGQDDDDEEDDNDGG